MAVPAFKFAISESLIGSSVMFGGSIKKLQVGLVDFGTFTTAKEAVEVVEGWSRSATEDILGIKKSTSAEVVLVPSSRYSMRKLTVCPAQPLPPWLMRMILDEP